MFFGGIPSNDTTIFHIGLYFPIILLCFFSNTAGVGIEWPRGAQSSYTNCCVTSRRARPAATASLSGSTSRGAVGLALRHLGCWGGEIAVAHAGAAHDSMRRK